MIDTTLAWLATYLIHSSALILAVWGFTRWCSLDPLTRSLLWKIALVGGLFTATLQTGLGVQPALGHIEVGAPPLPAPPTPPIETVEIEEDAPEGQQIVVLEVDDGEQAVTIVSLHGNAGPAWEPMPALPVPPPPPLPGTADAEPAEGGDLSAALLGLFLGGAILGVGRLAFTARRLRRLLHGRTDILRGSLAERLAVLLARARLGRRAVRLTMSPALVSPIALASREIVVPEEASELEVRQQEAMLAHELAHVVRQDPAWLVLAAVIEAALFIQPLNRLARAGMQEAAEELADDWAVRHLGTGLHLARCLTEVASWHSRGTPGPFVSPMASGSGSALVQRVTRLLDDRSRERGPWAGAGRLLFAGALLAAVAWGAPGISVGLAQAEVIELSGDEDELAEVPEFDLADEAYAPVLAMNTVAGDANHMVTVDPEPSGRDRRLHRRAARLDRKAEKARAKAARLRGEGDAGKQVIVVRDDRVHITRDGGQVVIIRDHDGDDHDDDDDDGDEHVRHPVFRVHPGHGPHGPRGPHFDRAEIDRIRKQAHEQAREAHRVHRAEAERLRDQARELARNAPRIDAEEIERIREHAREMARNAPHMQPEELEALGRQAEAMGRRAEAMGRRVRGLSPEELAEIQADAERLAEEGHGLSQEDIRRIERAAEAAARVNPQEIERSVRRALEQAPGLDAATRRHIEEELQRELGKLGKDREKLGKDREKAEKDRDEQREKQREKAAKEREKAEKQRQKQRDEAAKQREKAEKQREKAERKDR